MAASDDTILNAIFDPETPYGSTQEVLGDEVPEVIDETEKELQAEVSLLERSLFRFFMLDTDRSLQLHVSPSKESTMRLSQL